METKTDAKPHRMPGPVKRSASRPILALKGKIQSQVKLETVLNLVSENDDVDRTLAPEDGTCLGNH